MSTWRGLATVSEMLKAPWLERTSEHLYSNIIVGRIRYWLPEMFTVHKKLKGAEPSSRCLVLSWTFR